MNKNSVQQFHYLLATSTIERTTIKKQYDPSNIVRVPKVITAMIKVRKITGAVSRSIIWHKNSPENMCNERAIERFNTRIRTHIHMYVERGAGGAWYKRKRGGGSSTDAVWDERGHRREVFIDLRFSYSNIIHHRRLSFHLPSHKITLTSEFKYTRHSTLVQISKPCFNIIPNGFSSIPGMGIIVHNLWSYMSLLWKGNIKLQFVFEVCVDASDTYPKSAERELDRLVHAPPIARIAYPSCCRVSPSVWPPQLPPLSLSLPAESLRPYRRFHLYDRCAQNSLIRGQICRLTQTNV